MQYLYFFILFTTTVTIAKEYPIIFNTITKEQYSTNDYAKISGDHLRFLGKIDLMNLDIYNSYSKKFKGEMTYCFTIDRYDNIKNLETTTSSLIGDSVELQLFSIEFEQLIKSYNLKNPSAEVTKIENKINFNETPTDEKGNVNNEFLLVLLLISTLSFWASRIVMRN